MANRSEINFQNGAAMVLAVEGFDKAPKRSMIPPKGFMEIKWFDTNYYIRETAVTKEWTPFEIDNNNIWGIYARNSIHNYNRIYEARGEIYCYMGSGINELKGTMYFISADADAFLNIRDWQEIQVHNRLSYNSNYKCYTGVMTMGFGSVLPQFIPTVKIANGAYIFAKWKGLI